MRHEEGAGHNGLGQRFGATVWGNGLGQRLDTTFLRARAACGCGPSSNYDTQSKPQEGAGLAHQSRRRTRDFGKSPRNLMPGSETVWGNGLGQRFGATVRHNLSARPSGVWLRAVLELRHGEGAGHNHNPIRGSRQGHRRFWSRTSTLTPGWIQPPDKPVSDFGGMDPCLTPGYPPPYINRLPFVVIEDDVAALPW